MKIIIHRPKKVGHSNSKVMTQSNKSQNILSLTISPYLSTEEGKKPNRTKQKIKNKTQKKNPENKEQRKGKVHRSTSEKQKNTMSK